MGDIIPAEPRLSVRQNGQVHPRLSDDKSGRPILRN